MTASSIRNAQHFVDRDFAERLVCEVRKRPILYDASHADYKDRGRVEMEWTSVAAALTAPVETVRKRWQNLRGSYSRSLTSRNLPSGNGAKRAIRFYLERQMSFLKCHMAHATMMGNYGTASDDADVKTLETDPSVPLPLNVNSALCLDNEETNNVTVENTANYSSTTLTSDGRLSQKRHHSESLSAIEVALLGFLERKEAKSKRLYDPDFDFINGLLPQIKQLKHRNKRKFFRTMSSTLFNMLDQQEDEACAMDTNDTNS